MHNLYLKKKYYVLLIGCLIGIVITFEGCNDGNSRRVKNLSDKGVNRGSGLQQKSSSISRASWGAALVQVSDSSGIWTLQGENRKVTFNSSDFSMVVKAGSANWRMVPSQPNDIIVRKQGKEKEYSLSLADAKKKK